MSASSPRRGDRPSPLDQPRRDGYRDMSTAAVFGRQAAGPPDPATDPDGYDRWADSLPGPSYDEFERDNVDWFYSPVLDAEDLDETDPALPLFSLKAHQPGVN